MKTFTVPNPTVFPDVYERVREAIRYTRQAYHATISMKFCERGPWEEYKRSDSGFVCVVSCPTEHFDAVNAIFRRAYLGR